MSRKYYNLDPGPTMGDYELPFNPETDNLMNYIYKLYNYLDKSITLEKFRYLGY